MKFTDDDVIDNVSTVVDGLNVLGAVLGGTPEKVGKIAKRVFEAVMAAKTGKHPLADKIIGELRTELAANDADADEALAEKFDHGGEDDGED